MRSVATVLFLVVVATVVAAGARRLRLPAPSLLVVVGVVVGVIPHVPAIRVTPDVVSLVVLPPLLYAAAEELPWRDLRTVWRPVGVLAVGLVAASAAAIGVVASLTGPLSAGMAFVLGAVLASTDPVAVTALGRRLPLPVRVQTLIQAESLFNDATSLVVFRVAISVVVAGGSVSWPHAVGEFAILAGGGAAIGLVLALGVLLIRRRTEDPVMETVIALVTPYAAYVAAEAVDASGVTAVVVAGTVIGAQVDRLTTARVRLQLHAVYGTVVFLLESVVFALIGLQLPQLVRDLTGEEQGWPLQALAITGVLLLLRLLWVFPLSWAYQRREGRQAWPVATVVTWAGARGVVPLAAALSIPLTLDNGQPVPHRSLVLVLATAVIVITLVVQGFTLAPVVRRTGVVRPTGATRSEEALARRRMAEAALADLNQYEDVEAVPSVVVDGLRQDLQSRLDRARAAATNDPDAEPEPTDPVELAATQRRVRRDLIAAESAELVRLYTDGHIGDATRRRLQRQLDLEDERLSDH